MATATAKKEERYIEAVGRRKTAIARARLTPAAKMSVTVNGKDVNDYFPTQALQTAALEAFLKVGLTTQFAVSIVVKGGGISGQAIAVRPFRRTLLSQGHVRATGRLR